MAYQNMEATILLEVAPDVEVIDGLVYVTDHIGSLTIRRCFRPATLGKMVAAANRALDELYEHRRLGVVPIKAVH